MRDADVIFLLFDIYFCAPKRPNNPNYNKRMVGFELIYNKKLKGVCAEGNLWKTDFLWDTKYQLINP